MWAAIRRRLPLILLAGGGCAVVRPLLWSLHDQSPSRAVLRAAILFLGSSAVVTVGVAIHAWRKRPSLLGATRSVDDALGLQEVVASGFAFERDARADEMAMRAIEKAREATHHVDIAKALRAKAPKPERPRFFWHAIALAAIGLGVGAIDRLVVERTLHPMTERENAASTELKRAAEAAEAAKHAQEQNNEAPKNPKADEVVEAAKRAAEAAERGDRKRAAEALEDMRKAQRAMEADDRAQAKSLKDLRDEIEAGAKGSSKRDGSDPPQAQSGGRPSATASEALEKTKRDLDAAAKSKDPAELKKLAERLARAEAAARAAAESAKSREGGKEGSGKEGSGKSAESAWSRAAEALKEAREAAARGDSEAAKRAMERAEREIAALEKAREMGAKSGAMTKLAENASELDRAMRGSESAGEKDAGENDGGAAGKSQQAKGAKAGGGQKDGKGDPSGQPGGGGGESDRNPSGAEQRKLKVNGNLQARTDVREGERAAGVIQGMGKGGDPRAYKEVFPSYDSVVEEGLRDDAIPAARRPTVRRYFSSIRPSSEESGNSQ